MKSILIVVAHPDDEVLALPGTILRHKNQGDRLHIVYCFEGSSARYKPEDSDRKKIKMDNKYREAMAYRFCNEVGFHSINFFNYPNLKGTQSITLEISQKLVDLQRKIQANRIYTHNPNDINVDHTSVSNAVLGAFRPLNDTSTSILFFEVLSSSEWNYEYPFKPNFFVDVTPYLIEIKDLIACYSSEMRQIPHPRNFESYRARCRYRGMQSNLEYSEGFHLYRNIVSKEDLL